ncbi:hypothetical protein BD779DRAFT_1629960 [Infundibulicybe gibba]|nr:hypothetical protein BD779DRAFT_1629960 [Infundibulicybe gibba]
MYAISLNLFIVACSLIIFAFIKISRPFPISSHPKSILLLLHTLYLTYILLLHPPPNLFLRLGLPLNTSTDRIRQVLQQASSNGTIPIGLESVVKRLASFEMRDVYVRFGHTALATCTYCESPSEFALYALPRPLLEYIREVAIIGLLTPARTPVRTFGTGVLLAAGLAEAYYLTSSAIPIPLRGSNQATFWWHDILLTLRHVLFLLLPILLSVLPYAPLPPLLRSIFPRPIPPVPETTPASTATPLERAAATLQHTLHTLHTLKYTSAAASRHPTLRTHAQAWWIRERQEGEWVRTDAGVQAASRGSGLGFDGFERENDVNVTGEKEGNEKPKVEPGPLLVSARIAVKALLEGVAPSEHWVWGA